MKNDSDVKELIPGYALDCLDEGDRRLVSTHLESCPECRAELRAYQEVAGQLALMAPDSAPPPGLKRRLLVRLQPRETTHKPMKGKRLWWHQIPDMFQQISPAWGMVSLVLILALVTSNVVLWRQVSQLSGITPTPVLQVVNLSGTDFTPDASGMMILSEDGEYGTLVVDNLPELSEDRQYQLWLIEGEQRTSGGVFSVSQDGYASLEIASPRPLDSYSGFGITIEPAGGSPGPTGEKVLGGNF